jgi:GNAT superfamily N-acetyltransferase
MKPRSLPEGYSFEEWWGNGTQISVFSTVGGQLDSVFRFSSRIYTVTNIDVEPEFRRRRIGTTLVETARDHARYIGADAIMAAIVSRECLDVMNRVFGEEHIEVYLLGKYAEEGVRITEETATSAGLWYDLR